MYEHKSAAPNCGPDLKTLKCFLLIKHIFMPLRDAGKPQNLCSKTSVIGRL